MSILNGHCIRVLPVASLKSPTERKAGPGGEEARHGCAWSLGYIVVAVSDRKEISKEE